MYSAVGLVRLWKPLRDFSGSGGRRWGTVGVYENVPEECDFVSERGDELREGSGVDRRPEMDRREVALELVKLGANTGFIVTGSKPEFEVLLRSYSQAFEAVIESERTPMLKK